MLTLYLLKKCRWAHCSLRNAQMHTYTCKHKCTKSLGLPPGQKCSWKKERRKHNKWNKLGFVTWKVKRKKRRGKTNECNCCFSSESFIDSLHLTIIFSALLFFRYCGWYFLTTATLGFPGFESGILHTPSIRIKYSICRVPESDVHSLCNFAVYS